VAARRRPKKDPALEALILALVAPHTAGDPMSEQKWLNCRLTDIRQRLLQQGHVVSKPVISRILRAHHYTLHANVKQATGADHPDRDTQFCYIQSQRAAHLALGQPVISVDTKKKEGDQRGYQEKRIGGQLQEQRPGLGPKS
jgi:hypothetical protein